MMNAIEMERKIRELKELERICEEASDAMEAIKDEIKANMGDETELFTNSYKVTYKEVVSSRVDTTAFKKEFPDIAALYTKKMVTRPLRIS